MVGDKIQCIKGTRLIHVESMIKLGGGISVVCVILNIGLSSTNSKLFNFFNHTNFLVFLFILFKILILHYHNSII
jgi:hypothetical protein